MKIRNLDLIRNPSNEGPATGASARRGDGNPPGHAPVKNKLIRGLCTLALLLGAALPSLAAADASY